MARTDRPTFGRPPAAKAAALVALALAVAASATPAFAQTAGMVVPGDEPQAEESLAVSGSDDTGAASASALSSMATASIAPAPEDEALIDPYAADNPREPTIDGLRLNRDPTRDDATGIRLGSFVLKPSMSQTLNRETTTTGSQRSTRTFMETGLKGTITSDWSRHQLSVTGEGTWQRNLSGEGATKPRARIDGELRLDINRDTTATFSAGYAYEREDSTDPNAITGASVQSGIDTFSVGAGLQRNIGPLRGSVRGTLVRSLYGDATLSNGTSLSLEDRNRTTGTLTGRIGYELSPALIPFLEASVGRSLYDLRTDQLGFERSYDSYSSRSGVEIDLGEKLRGEIGAGYQTVSFHDDRLQDLSGFTVDGRIDWSPQRGTLLDLSLATTLEPSTTAGESGALVYTLRSGLTHELRSSLVARLSGSIARSNYPDGSATLDQTVWTAAAGLSWDMTRSLALTGDVSYERTTPSVGDSTNVARIGIGLTMRR